MRVVIQRASPLSVQVDGNTVHTRTRGKTVADVLAQEQLSLFDQDYVIPEESTPLRAGMTIRVVRAREETVVEQDTIGFETVWGPSAEVELDQEQVLREGQPGIIARRFRIRYEDGQVITQTLQEEWRAQEPQDRLIGYGTKIVSRQVDTPDGPRSYWRKIRVLATSYTAATSGKARDHPEYGVTRLGWKMRRGIIAVDPRVINFGAQIYVPGYGVGVSGDTGGKILGRRVDLGYDEWDLRLWYKWMDVYLLDPPPPRGRIQWVLPDWPKER
jgi:3D (Asp-Asp-Asp) domain-containing protein